MAGEDPQERSTTEGHWLEVNKAYWLEAWGGAELVGPVGLFTRCPDVSMFQSCPHVQFLEKDAHLKKERKRGVRPCFWHASLWLAQSQRHWAWTLLASLASGRMKWPKGPRNVCYLAKEKLFILGTPTQHCYFIFYPLFSSEMCDWRHWTKAEVEPRLMEIYKKRPGVYSESGSEGRGRSLQKYKVLCPKERTWPPGCVCLCLSTPIPDANYWVFFRSRTDAIVSGEPKGVIE